MTMLEFCECQCFANVTVCWTEEKKKRDEFVSEVPEPGYNVECRNAD